MLALIALVIMPLGMSGAPVLAAPVAQAGQPAGHCDGQPVEREAPLSKMDCTAMCAALPPTDGPAPTPVVKPVAPRAMAVCEPFSGIEPESATPPPRLS